MLIKVCGNCDLETIENLELIQEIDFLGFIFYPNSPRNFQGNLNERKIKKRVGVFVNETMEFIQEKVSSHKLDFIQLHGKESPEFCKQIQKMKPVIKVFHIDIEFDFQQVEAFLDVCEYFLFDTKTSKFGGSGEKFPWEKLNEYSLSKEYFLSGGISISDSEILKNLPGKCIGIDINSKFELENGKKDCKLIQKFIKNIK
jgi:phosphoribosylanthranilate isomerase